MHSFPAVDKGWTEWPSSGLAEKQEGKTIKESGTLQDNREITNLKPPQLKIVHIPWGGDSTSQNLFHGNNSRNMQKKKITLRNLTAPLFLSA